LPKRIIQIASAIGKGDAISNCIFNLSDFLFFYGINNIIATNICENGVAKDNIVYLNKEIFDQIGDEDIVIYHFSNGSSLNRIIEKLKCKKILAYHNITPPEFFRDYAEDTGLDCMRALIDVKFTPNNYNYAIVMSEYSKNDLLSYGWEKDKVIVIPLISKIETQKKETVTENIEFLYVGRIAPHKRIEDIISIFGYYHKNCNDKSKLKIVGSNSYLKYEMAINGYVNELELLDCVEFCGHVSEEALENYYNSADLYICMSEHEGFGMPLFEAMAHSVPVIAYNSSAVGGVLGTSGVLVDNKDPKMVTDTINKILTDEVYYESIINSQNNRVRELDLYSNSRQILELLDSLSNRNYISIKKESILENIDISKYVKSLWNDKFENAARKGVVVYGCGKIGKQVIEIICNYSEIDIVAICDNNYRDDSYKNIPVFGHEECIRRYKDNIFIIAIKGEVNNIKNKMQESMLKEENIWAYSVSSGKIIKV